MNGPVLKAFTGLNPLSDLFMTLFLRVLSISVITARSFVFTFTGLCTYLFTLFIGFFLSSNFLFFHLLTLLLLLKAVSSVAFKVFSEYIETVASIAARTEA